MGWIDAVRCMIGKASQSEFPPILPPNIIEEAGHYTPI